jgi:hypothetical protein
MDAGAFQRGLGFYEPFDGSDGHDLIVARPARGKRLQ